MCSILNSYQLKIDYYKYVLYKFHGNYKAKTYSKYTKEKESKQTTTESHQITKEENKRRKEQRNYKTVRKELKGQ